MENNEPNQNINQTGENGESNISKVLITLHRKIHKITEKNTRTPEIIGSR